MATEYQRLEPRGAGYGKAGSMKKDHTKEDAEFARTAGDAKTDYYEVARSDD